MMLPFCNMFYVQSTGCSHLCFPKLGRFIQPSFCYRAGAQPKAVGQAGIVVKFGWNPQGIQRFYTPLHGSPVCNAIAFSHTGESWWIVFRIITVARVLHNYCTRL